MDEIITLLSHIPLFEDMSTDELSSVASLFRERKFKKGATLFLEGDSGHDFYVVKSGVVKIYLNDFAKENTLAFFRKGEFFGEMSLLLEGFTRSASALTIEPSVLYMLHQGDFRRYLMSRPPLCLKMLEVTTQRLRDANRRIHELTFLDVRSRIVKSLLRLTEDYGTPVPGGVRIDLKLTHQEIASMAGTVRESVTKLILELQEKNIVHIEERHIIVRELDKLHQY